MARKNFVASAIWLLLFVIFYIMSDTMLKEQIQFYPKLICIFGAALSIILALQTHFKRAKSEDSSPIWEYDNSQTKKLALTILLISIYVFLIIKIGFLITSIVFMFALIHLMGSEGNIKVELAVSVLFPSVIYFVFVYLFKFSLPTGFLI